MTRRLTRQERLIRIELARTRAALERQNVSRCVHDLHEALTPAGLWQMLLSGQRRRRSASRRYGGLLMQLFALSRRYPFLLGTASAALSSLARGRRSWLWRIGLTALAGWKVLQRVQARQPEISASTRTARDTVPARREPSDYSPS